MLNSCKGCNFFHIVDIDSGHITLHVQWNKILNISAVYNQLLSI